MEFIYEYGLFLAKTFTFIIAVFAIIGIASTAKPSKKAQLVITDISKELQETKNTLIANFSSKKELKDLKKAKNKNIEHNTLTTKKRIFLVDFKGSTDAKEVTNLRSEVTAILSIATPEDEVLVNLESPGGQVHGYGLAASQLTRIKNKGIPLTVTVDKVAASGGYMMACVADKIIAAPFAILGSIGVVAQLPNFNKLLEKNSIDFEQITAGEFKRTVSMFGKTTDEGREKFKEELTVTHELFKNFITKNRPDLDIQSVATGEHWFGTDALKLGLIDAIATSDDYINDNFEANNIIKIEYKQPKKMSSRFANAASLSIESVFDKIWQKGMMKFN